MKYLIIVVCVMSISFANIHCGPENQPLLQQQQQPNFPPPPYGTQHNDIDVEQGLGSINNNGASSRNASMNVRLPGAPKPEAIYEGETTFAQFWAYNKVPADIQQLSKTQQQEWLNDTQAVARCNNCYLPCAGVTCIGGLLAGFVTMLYYMPSGDYDTEHID